MFSRFGQDPSGACRWAGLADGERADLGVDAAGIQSGGFYCCMRPETCVEVRGPGARGHCPNNSASHEPDNALTASVCEPTQFPQQSQEAGATIVPILQRKN